MNNPQITIERRRVDPNSVSFTKGFNQREEILRGNNNNNNQQQQSQHHNKSSSNSSSTTLKIEDFYNR